ncbi:hypothetical protein [Streptomyces sp. 8N616]|uniref:hypothetical protein n=1 Tax=Streptomyces sp. 8N616 TaxID=3457414 RepID=UPI003FD38126
MATPPTRAMCTARRWRWSAVAGTAAVLLVTVGCGAVEERRSAAMAAALDFERAVRAEDAATVCEVLAPGTREEVAQSARADCAQGVLDEDVPSAGDRPGDVRSVDVHGRQARVVLTADTLFLSQFSSGWKVVAAGCTPRPQQPYRCTLKNG